MQWVPPEVVMVLAHINLTVSQFEKEHEFYSKLLPKFGMECGFNGEEIFYHVGVRTAIGIVRCDSQYADEHFVQLRCGLYHLCLRRTSTRQES